MRLEPCKEAPLSPRQKRNELGEGASINAANFIAVLKSASAEGSEKVSAGLSVSRNKTVAGVEGLVGKRAN